MPPGSSLDSDLYDRDQVITIINSVIRKMQDHEGLSRDVICGELLSLKRMIEELRAQLLSSDAGDITHKHIPVATDELGAVIHTTEQATTKIMESCESIAAALHAGGPGMQDDIENHITNIFEACTFQDITGQRIRKVEKALKTIDEKASTLIRILEKHLAHEKFGPSRPAASTLLNGPAMPEEAMSQDEIDKLLNSFGN